MGYVREPMGYEHARYHGGTAAGQVVRCYRRGRLRVSDLAELFARRQVGHRSVLIVPVRLEFECSIIQPSKLPTELLVLQK